MTEQSPTIFADLGAEAPIPARGIHSQTLSDADGVELILFAFAAGEQLSEHTSARPAIIHVLSGEADVTVGDEARAAGAGTWIRMAPNTRHSIVARTGLVMALYLLPRPERPEAAAEAAAEASAAEG
jgi:quercetin dioxygenase-like cupin family protein